MTDITSQNLQERIAAFQAQVLPNVPPEILSTLMAETAKLARAGIASRSLQVGERAPDFNLPNVYGERVTLSALLARGPVVLTFYRGGWCPYCNLQIRAYQEILPQIRASGASLVAVTPELPDHSLELSAKNKLSFDILTDAHNAAARTYRLVYALGEALRPLYKQLGSDLAAWNGDDSWELPLPATFVLDRHGVVRLAFVDADYTRRLEPASILAALAPLGG